MKRILKDTGSIYFHCDNTMGHYIKLLMDIIFGENNFRNEIVWYYKNASRGKYKNANSHDIIFWYSKSKEYIFKREDVLQPFESNMTKWRYTKGGQKDKEIPLGKTPDDVIILPSINTMGKERTGYPTQKPITLLERIIKASSNEGDIVLDPFCGCATTCVASEKLNRRWVGIDVSVEAYDLVRERMEKEVYPMNLDHLKIEDKDKTDIHFTHEVPKRTDGNGEDVLKKYVYIISHPKHRGFYKVGIASDWKSRLNSYQTSDPKRQYQIEYKYHTHLFREIEKHIHEKFDNLLEWVRADKEDIIKEIEGFDIEEYKKAKGELF